MRTQAFTALLAILLPMHQLMAQNSGGSSEPSPATTPGFSMALFDTATIGAVLDNNRAIGIRFYNVLVPPDNKEGSAMAVGIRMDASEINSGRAYQVSLGFVEGKIQMSSLRSKHAKNACAAMEDSGSPSYSAAFTRAEVEALMAHEGCQALMAEPVVTDKDETSMRLTAMKIVNGKAVALGSGPGYSWICSLPCPSACGPSGNYVYRKQ